MYVCMYVYMYVCVYVSKYVCMYLCTYVCIYASMHLCMYLCIYVMRVYMYFWFQCFFIINTLSLYHHVWAIAMVTFDVLQKIYAH